MVLIFEKGYELFVFSFFFYIWTSSKVWILILISSFRYLQIIKYTLNNLYLRWGGSFKSSKISKQMVFYIHITNFFFRFDSKFNTFFCCQSHKSQLLLLLLQFDCILLIYCNNNWWIFIICINPYIFRRLCEKGFVYCLFVCSFHDPILPFIQ